MGLNFVLEALCSPLLKQLELSGLKWLSVKTAFLSPSCPPSDWGNSMPCLSPGTV